MNLTNSKIKGIVFSLFMLTASIALTTSCNKEDDSQDKTATIVDTYIGTYSSSDGTQSLNYKVDVIKIDNTTVKIKPEGADATVFEATVTVVNEDGSVSCGASDAQAIAFTKADGVMNLAYTIGGDSLEAFAGTKQ